MTIYENEHLRLEERARELGLEPSCRGRHLEVCIACGESFPALSLSDAGGLSLHNHHCDPKREARIEAGRKSHDRPHPPAFATRLADGFGLLRGDNERDYL